MSKDTGNAVKEIAFILKCGHEHSHDSEAWGNPKDNEREFYYAYSHVSFICACIWTRACGESTDAETFTDLLNNPPKDWEQAVKSLLED